jgi:hypothetical protein
LRDGGDQQLQQALGTARQPPICAGTFRLGSEERAKAGRKSRLRGAAAKSCCSGGELLEDKVCNVNGMRRATFGNPDKAHHVGHRALHFQICWVPGAQVGHQALPFSNLFIRCHGVATP